MVYAKIRRIRRRCRPPEPVFSTNHIPDLTERMVIVTSVELGSAQSYALLSQPEDVG